MIFACVRWGIRLLCGPMGVMAEFVCHSDAVGHVEKLATWFAQHGDADHRRMSQVLKVAQFPPNGVLIHCPQKQRHPMAQYMPFHLGK